MLHEPGTPVKSIVRMKAPEVLPALQRRIFARRALVERGSEVKTIDQTGGYQGHIRFAGRVIADIRESLILRAHPQILVEVVFHSRAKINTGSTCTYSEGRRPATACRAHGGIQRPRKDAEPDEDAKLFAGRQR